MELPEGITNIWIGRPSRTKALYVGRAHGTGRGRAWVQQEGEGGLSAPSAALLEPTHGSAMAHGGLCSSGLQAVDLESLAAALWLLSFLCVQFVAADYGT